MTRPDPITGAVPLSGERAAELLADALGRARTHGGGSILVFDLDSTLLDNRPRQAAIMREYGEAEGVRALAAAEAEHWAGWDFRIAMANAGLDASGIERHAAPFRDYWRERFFTSAYCRLDRPIPGAPRYASDAAATGARICYVTGRHEEMRAGTLVSFERGRFPIPDEHRIRLIMKPSLDETDDDFKARTYATLRELGRVVAAFDNEPAHINGYRDAFPDALAVHLATDHSLREIKVAAGIPSIRDFTPYRG